MENRIYFQNGRQIYEVDAISNFKTLKRDGSMQRNKIFNRHERQEDGKGGRGVPLVPEMKWNKDGSPDYSHLNR